MSNKYTKAEVLMMKEIMKQLTNIRDNHPHTLGLYLDDAIRYIKEAAEFSVDMIERQQEDS